MDKLTIPPIASNTKKQMAPAVLDRLERLIQEGARGTSLERMDLAARRHVAEIMVRSPLFEKLRAASVSSIRYE